jgi:BolA protein
MVGACGANKRNAAEKRRNPVAMGVADRIRRKLTEAFQPASLDVVDESHLHKGHAGHRPEGESHFRVRITADAFAGKSRVAAHRMIYAALAGEIQQGVHALAIEVKAVGR